MKKTLLIGATLIALFQACSKSEVGPKEQPLTSITLNEVELLLNPTETFQLTASLNPENSSNKELIWTSSDEKIASVSKTGMITANTLGEAVITAKNLKHNKSTSARVRVVAVPISSLKLSFDKLSMRIGEVQTVKIEATPEDASLDGLKWTSSDIDIATVSQKGELAALKVGKSTITVSTSDEKVKSSFILTVNPILVSDITLDKKVLSIKVSQKERLVATIAPSDATDITLVWTSSDNKIATVDQDGNVEAIAVGNATITVKSAVGKVSDKSEVTVVPLFNFSEVKKAYKANDGLTVTLNDFSVYKNEFGTYSYTIVYALKNETKEAIDEGTFKMYNLSKETSESQYGFFGKFYPGEGTSRSYVFKSTEPLEVLEYNANFFSSKPSDETIKWKAPEVK